MSRIFWDTNLFIYLIEDHGDLSERVALLRRRMIERNDDLYTSALTLGEVLVKPVEVGNEVLARRYEAALRQGAAIIPFDVEAARLYAGIRKDRTIRPPDAIQLACAAQVRVDLFITNDERLSAKSIPRIQFVSSLLHAFL
ncbi:MAG TPA: PIN domain-containing protein [Candidatus Saccharimonadales bacterium]|nr:PIN domain-containing protein [Candidatus Saccharimonadales bacterium]